MARRIHGLEARLAVKLFYRSNLGYSLTVSGEQLQPIAEAMEANYLAATAMEAENPAAAGYLRAHGPVQRRADLSRHEFIGYIEDMLFTPELNYLSAIGKNINPRIRSTNLITQLHAILAGSGLCVLPVFIARRYSELVPVLPDKISLKRAFFMHIHEDNRKCTHVRAAAAFIAAEIQQSAALLGLAEGAA